MNPFFMRFNPQCRKFMCACELWHLVDRFKVFCVCACRAVSLSFTFLAKPISMLRTLYARVCVCACDFKSTSNNVLLWFSVFQSSSWPLTVFFSVSFFECVHYVVINSIESYKSILKKTIKSLIWNFITDRRHMHPQRAKNQVAS